MGKVLFIYRAKEFSPNNVAKDKAILDLVRQRIEEAGHDTKVVSEEELDVRRDTQDVKAIVGMERRFSNLLSLENCVVPTYNKAQAILNVATSREWTLTKLQLDDIPVPDYWVFDPEEDEMFQCEPELQVLLPGWVKAMRHDGAKEGDVVFVRTPLEADTEVARLWMENVQDIILTKHIEGDLVKVYAVTNQRGEIQFIRWFYPQDEGYTKFGEEANNPLPEHHAINQTELRGIVEKTSRCLGLQFFGIDIIANKEKITIIDVNDWPSYSICKDEAADWIARTILADIEAS